MLKQGDKMIFEQDNIKVTVTKTKDAELMGEYKETLIDKTKKRGRF